MSFRSTLLLLVSALMTFAFALGPSGAGMVSAQDASGTVSLTTGTTPVGPALFTADGKALYTLSYDTFGTPGSPAKSQCTDKCLGAWPALLAPTATGPFAVAGGVQLAGLGTIARTDIGSSTVYQVTYFGRPLYMFINDKAPGQSNGENVGAFLGLWNLVSTNGLPNAGVPTVSLESSDYGQILSTGTAFNTFRTLYNLTADPPNSSACNAGCARFWPPLLTTGAPHAGTGVTAAGLGTTKRPDGTLQVTYFGTPLYLYAFDLSPGAKSGLTNGQDNVDPFLGNGNGGVWYTVSATGTSAPAPATVTSASTSLGSLLAFGTSPLYSFSADTPAASACNGQCARVWNPLLTNVAPTASAGSGVTATGLGTVKRSDGTTQVTYDGHPLYLFSKDYAGISGQKLTSFGGTFTAMQASGSPTLTTPSKRTTLSIPEVTSTSWGGRSAFFTVAFTSTSPGAGMVLFGPGPGCNALVETSLRDAGSGTTDHVVTVMGNDLPGTVGDIGIQPGTTYSFEVVTAGATTQTDNNKGACYTVTVPTS